ncbi:MAG: pitrilysin family protein [Treponema sp.]
MKSITGKDILLRAVFCIALCGTAVQTVSAETVENLKDVQVVTLSNGIPLYVKKNTANRKLALAVIVKGGTDYLTRETSGLENALFIMMTYGSKNYSYDKLQQLAYQMSFSISPSSSREGSVLAMSCIDYYFDKVLPVFTDAFINPVYNEDQYKILMTNYKQELQQLQTDPQSMLGYTVTKTVFSGHPYEVSSVVKPYSIQNITIENMKRLHDRDMDARRIMVVAVGNFDTEKLAEQLDGTLGTIAAQTYELASQTIPPLKIGGTPVVITSDAAAGTGYLEKEYAGPSIDSTDLSAAAVAASMYSQVLYNVVREKYGACYTPSCSISPMKAGLADVYIFKASDLAGVVKYEKEAQDIFASGKVIDGKNDDGSYRFSPVADRLEGYKNQYINSFYDSSVTNGGVAGRIATSLLEFGDPYTVDEKIVQIGKVSADEVEKAFKKYWVDNTYQWFAVVGPADKDKIQF